MKDIVTTVEGQVTTVEDIVTTMEGQVTTVEVLVITVEGTVARCLFSPVSPAVRIAP